VFNLRSSLQQAAALPLVTTAEEPRVLLITSRGSKRWILPKGWPAKNLTLAETAAREAEEEAGVTGDIDQDPVGTYDYAKRADGGYDVNCRVFVYPLNVRVQHLAWKERGQRKARWCAFSTAAELVRETGLSDLFNEIAGKPDHPALRSQINAWRDTR